MRDKTADNTRIRAYSGRLGGVKICSFHHLNWYDVRSKIFSEIGERAEQIGYYRFIVEKILHKPNSSDVDIVISTFIHKDNCTMNFRRALKTIQRLGLAVATTATGVAR